MFHEHFTAETWLIDCGLEAALLLAVVYGLYTVLLNTVSAHDRHFALLVSFIACLLLPVANLSGASTASPISPRYDGASLITFLCGVWLTGVLLMLACQLATILRVECETRRILRELRPWRPDCSGELCDGCHVRQPPPILVDPDSSSASIQGLWRPVIKVGGDIIGLPLSQQRQIVLHELQHFRRRDLQSMIVARLALAAYWPVPFVWWLAGRFALDNERSCDDAVLIAGSKPRDYAETLISAFERQPASAPARTFALSVTPGRDQFRMSLLRWLRLVHSNASPLHQRLLSIISPKTHRTPSATLRALSVGIVFSLTIVCAQANPLARLLVASGPQTLCVAIATTSDDAEENVATGEVMVASRDLDLSYDKQQEMHPMVGLRFSVPGLPRGSRILSAKIVFVGDELAAGDPQVFIACQQDPSPMTFLKRPHDLSRRLDGTEKAIEWRPGSDWYENSRTPDSITPELRELVQGLVDHAGWSGESSIVFCLTSPSSSPSSYREISSFDHELGPSVAPVLKIVYQLY